MMQGRVFLGRYEIIRLLGEGGMGRVYLAQQLDLGRQVVVKVMHEHVAADPIFRERFTRETLVMARFQHPYAVTLYDAKVDDADGSCIVMEYIRGVSLEDLLRGGQRMDPVRVSRLLRMLCEVLQAAHTEGIIHRDLKPANLMIVDPNTPHEMLKVMDFGLAKLLGPDRPGGAEISNAEFTVGTPGYMCPEQARGEEMDGRGDLYSVGVILYEMLTGRMPFANKTTMEVLLAHASEEPPAFASFGVGDEVPIPVEDVVRASMAKDPADRPATARDLAEAFEAALVSAEMVAPRPSANGKARPAPAAAAPARTVVPAPPVSPSSLSGGRQPVRVPPPAPAVYDPLAIVNHFDAWMPEKIATYKLRGYIQDVGGELVDSVPGRIRVRLGGRGCVYALPNRGALSWLGLGRKAPDIDLELRLQRPEQRDNQLRITVVIKPTQSSLTTDVGFRSLCNQIFCDVRGYLMGSTGGVVTRA